MKKLLIALLALGTLSFVPAEARCRTKCAPKPACPAKCPPKPCPTKCRIQLNCPTKDVQCEEFTTTEVRPAGERVETVCVPLMGQVNIRTRVTKTTEVFEEPGDCFPTCVPVCVPKHQGPSLELMESEDFVSTEDSLPALEYHR